jgi:uncharacterized protein with PIN domain
VKLLLDAMCGKLAIYCRMCGHDAADALDRGIEDDDRLRALAREEGRTLVTRDRELAARAERSVLLESRDVGEQLREFAAAGVALDPADEPSWCGRCNGVLEAISGDETTPEYAPDPSERQVWRCVDCGQCFWKGSHWRRVKATLSDVT